MLIDFKNSFTSRLGGKFLLVIIKLKYSTWNTSNMLLHYLCDFFVMCEELKKSSEGQQSLAA